MTGWGPSDISPHSLPLPLLWLQEGVPAPPPQYGFAPQDRRWQRLISREGCGDQRERLIPPEKHLLLAPPQRPLNEADLPFPFHWQLQDRPAPHPPSLPQTLNTTGHVCKSVFDGMQTHMPQCCVCM